MHSFQGVRPRGIVQKRSRERINDELPDSLLDNGCGNSDENRASPGLWQAQSHDSPTALPHLEGNQTQSQTGEERN